VLIQAPAEASAPTYQAAGTAVSGTGGITAAWPAHQAGDVALLVVETANQAISLSAPAGFVEVANSPQRTGAPGGAGGARLAVYWKRAATSSESNPTIADSGDHQIARIITFRGVAASGNPWDVTAGDAASSASTSVSIPGATTTLSNTLVVAIVATATDTTSPQTAGWANPNLSSLTECLDNSTPSGNGGGFGAAYGVKTTVGTYASTTATLATASVQARISIALKPASSPDVATGPSPITGAENVSVATDLSWTSGPGADSQDVYFGTTHPPAFRGNQTPTTFDPGILNASTTYYWRIDEVNSSGTTTGAVWSFTTASSPNLYRVTDYGATGDGVSSDTVAINAAVAAAAAGGGGTVYFPPGTFKSGSIILKNNITLKLSAGATLLATSAAEYSSVTANPWDAYQDWGHSHWESALIWGIGLRDIAIIGTGRIDGSAMTAGDPSNGYADRALSFKDCTGVRIEDIKIYRAGHFGIVATGCTNVTIKKLVIDTNRDGINIDCCDQVIIVGCVVNSPKDDAICLKSSYALGYKRATANVLIRDCTVTGYRVGDVINNVLPRANDPSGLKNGRIKCGTESNGGFRNITITNCRFENCYGFMLATVDGGDIDNINISDITMVDLYHPPIFLRLGNRARGPGPPPPGTYRNLTMSNVNANTVYGGLSCIASGIPGHRIENVVFNNVTVHGAGGGTSAQAAIVLGENEAGYPEATMFGTVTPSYAFYLRHVDGVGLHGCRFDYSSDDQRPALAMVDAKELELNNTDAQRSASNNRFVTFHDDVDNLYVHDCPDFPVIDATYGQIQSSQAKVHVGEPFTVCVAAYTTADGIVSNALYVDSSLYDTEYAWVNSGDSNTNIAFENIRLYTAGEVQVGVGGASLVQGVCLLSDFDMNYVTDMRDFAIMANDWLEDATQIVLGSDPAASWSFYEGSGTVAHDVSGHGNTGTLYGNPTWMEGKYDNAISFDGADDYVLVPNSGSISVGGSDYTISAWIYPHSVSGKRGIVTKVKDTMDKEYAFSIENGALTLEVENAANDGREATGPVVQTDVWQHVLVVFDSATKNAKFYLDGQLQAVVSDSINALPRYFNDNLCVGRWGGSYNNSYFDGLLDDVRIYDYALQPNAPSAADMNGDRKVDWVDLVPFSQEWMKDVRN